MRSNQFSGHVRVLLCEMRRRGSPGRKTLLSEAASELQLQTVSLSDTHTGPTGVSDEAVPASTRVARPRTSPGETAHVTVARSIPRQGGRPLVADPVRVSLVG